MVNRPYGIEYLVSIHTRPGAGDPAKASSTAACLVSIHTRPGAGDVVNTIIVPHGGVSIHTRPGAGDRTWIRVS